MASRQFVIIGLGNSANYLARHLTSLGHDIMVIDSHPEKIQDISSMVSQAVVADSTRKKQLASIPSLTKADSVIVCIGQDLEASLLTILNLRHGHFPPGTRCRHQPCRTPQPPEHGGLPPVHGRLLHRGTRLPQDFYRKNFESAVTHAQVRRTSYCHPRSTRTHT